MENPDAAPILPPELMLALGCVDAGRAVAKACLRKGYSLCILPGGETTLKPANFLAAVAIITANSYNN